MVDTPSYNRRSIRLKGYDYASPGAYFVTIVSYRREPTFGKIIGGKLTLSRIGRLAKYCLEQIPHHHRNVKLDEYVIMPNHIHGILVIEENRHNVSVGAGYKPALKSCTLPEIIRNFKTSSATKINRLRESPGVPVWQRNYYERIVRNDKELDLIREYINSNAINWRTDIYCFKNKTGQM